MGKRFFFTWDGLVAAVGAAFTMVLAIGMSAYAILEWDWLYGLIGCIFVWGAVEIFRSAATASGVAPIRLLSIDNGLIGLAKEKRQISEIVRIRYAISYTNKSVNLIPSGTDVTGFLLLEFADGSKWPIRSGVGVITVIDGNRGAEGAKSLVRVMSAISDQAGVVAERIAPEQFVALV
jgi:hypothetical protein